MNRPSPADLGVTAVRVAYPPRVPTDAQVAARAPQAVEEALGRRPRNWARRPALLALAVDTDADQCLSLGAWRLVRFGHTVHEGLVLPDAASEQTGAEVEAWAEDHPAAGRRARGARIRQVHRLTPWSEEVLRPGVLSTGDQDGMARSGRAWLATWDVGWTMSRLARYWTEAEGRGNAGAWSLGLFDVPEEHPDHRDAGLPGRGHPRLIVRAMSEELTWARWGRLPGTGVRGQLPAVLDLRQVVRALAGNGLDTLEAACGLFQVAPPRQGEGPAPVVDRARAVADLAESVLAECDWWEDRQGPAREELRPKGVWADPRKLYSSGSLAGQALRTIGCPPLGETEVSGQGWAQDQVVGAFAAAGFGGRTEALVVRDKTTPVQHWDHSGAYGCVARLGGVSDLMLAGSARAEDVAAVAASEYAGLAELHLADLVEELVAPAWWRRWCLCAVEVVPEGALLPVRVPSARRAGDYLVRLAHLTQEEPVPVWTTMADLAAGVLLDPGGPRARVRRALRLVPGPRRADLRPVNLPGGVTLDPADPGADIFAALEEAKAACRDRPRWTPRERERRTGGVKGLMVSLANGAPGRVDRNPAVPGRTRRRRGHDGAVTVIGADGTRLSVQPGEVVESAGADNFPPIPTAVVAGERLVMGLVEAMVRAQDGEVHQVLTDAVTVGAPEGPWWRRSAAPRPVDMAAIARVLHERLGVVVRPQFDTDRRPAHAYVVGRNRYVLVRGERVLHASEFALGGVYLDPSGRADRIGRNGAREWVSEAMAAVVRADRGRTLADLELPGWAEHLAVSPFRAGNRAQLDWLGPGARPFDRGLALHRRPNALRGPNDEEPAAPVARAPWSTPPEAWPDLAWRSRTGEPIELLDPEADWHRANLGLPGQFTPATIAERLGAWSVAEEAGSAPEAGLSGDQPVQRGPLRRRGFTMSGPPSLIGKEGADLTDRIRGVTATDEEVVVYAEGLDPAVRALRLVLRRLPPARRAELLPDRTERSVRKAVTGERVPQDLEVVIRRAAQAAIFGGVQVPEGDQLPGDTLSLLLLWAEQLARCANAPGCPGRRQGRSPLCPECWRARRARDMRRQRERAKGERATANLPRCGVCGGPATALYRPPGMGAFPACGERHHDEILRRNRHVAKEGR